MVGLLIKALKWKKTELESEMLKLKAKSEKGELEIKVLENDFTELSEEFLDTG